MRLDAWQAANPGVEKPPLFLGVRFANPMHYPNPPHPARRFQFSQGADDEPYKSSGLAFVMSQAQHGDKYNAFVTNLANTIAKYAEPDPLAPSAHHPPLDQLGSAFTPATVGAVGELDGPCIAHFGYFAGLLGDYATVHAQATGYDTATPEFWRPFSPEANDYIGVMARDFAENNKLTYAPMNVTDGILIKSIRDAETQNRLVILVIDPWSVRLTIFQQQMDDLDERVF